MRFLESALGVSAEAVGGMVTTFPALLTLSVDSNLKPKLHYLLHEKQVPPPHSQLPPQPVTAAELGARCERSSVGADALLARAGAGVGADQLAAAAGLLARQPHHASLRRPPGPARGCGACERPEEASRAWRRLALMGVGGGVEPGGAERDRERDRCDVTLTLGTDERMRRQACGREGSVTLSSMLTPSDDVFYRRFPNPAAVELARAPRKSALARQLGG